MTGIPDQPVIARAARKQVARAIALKRIGRRIARRINGRRTDQPRVLDARDQRHIRRGVEGVGVEHIKLGIDLLDQNFHGKAARANGAADGDKTTLNRLKRIAARTGAGDTIACGRKHRPAPAFADGIEPVAIQITVDHPGDIIDIWLRREVLRHHRGIVGHAIIPKRPGLLGDADVAVAVVQDVHPVPGRQEQV